MMKIVISIFKLLFLSFLIWLALGLSLFGIAYFLAGQIIAIFGLLVGLVGIFLIVYKMWSILKEVFNELHIHLRLFIVALIVVLPSSFVISVLNPYESLFFTRLFLITLLVILPSSLALWKMGVKWRSEK